MLIDLAASRPTRRPSRFWAPRPAVLDMLRTALVHDVVLVRGPAGVGKSALLRQLADDLYDDPSIDVQALDAKAAEGPAIGAAVTAFRDGADRHVLIVDDVDDHDTALTARLLGMLRDDPSLCLVVGTRHITPFEGSMTALEFDVHVVPSGALPMTVDDVAAVLKRNGVDAEHEAVETLTERTSGWPALVQLACTRLRLEEMPLGTAAEAASIAASARAAFTADVESRLGLPITDELRLLSIAPYITASLAGAMGIDVAPGSDSVLVRGLQATGLVWPSSTRLTLADPVREQWVADVTRTSPHRVEESRRSLLGHLVAAGDPLAAARLAADTGRWSTLTDILRSAGPDVWSRDAAAFGRLVDTLRARAEGDPVAWDTVLRLDPEASAAADAPNVSANALSRLPDARTAAATDIEKLAVRVSLLRAAARFALASDAASVLSDALRRREGPARAVDVDGWYQVGMTHLAMGRLHEAAHALGRAGTSAGPAERVRCQGVRAVIALLEGNVAGAADLLDEVRTSRWLRSPWGEGARLAEAWLALERGRPDETRQALSDRPSTPLTRELWPYAAAVHTLAHLLSGAASDGLGTLRAWETRARSTPPSHFQSTQILMARAKVLIALRQARKSIALFDGPFSLTTATAPSIALAHLYAGRAHDAYVMSTRWGVNQESSPRAALESLIISIVADVRLNGAPSHRTTLQRAQSISRRYELWTPWSAVAPEDRERILGLLDDETRNELAERRSFFTSSVSVPHLTKREQVVLAHLTPSSTIADIAHALVVSPNTVKTQLQSLYRKLEVSDRSSAIRAAHAWGLIEPDVEV